MNLHRFKLHPLALGAALALVSLAGPVHADSYVAVDQPRLDDLTASHGPVVSLVTGGTYWHTPDGFNRRFSFIARKHMDGAVSGEWQLVAGTAIVHGGVTCMTIVDDHTARIGGNVLDAHFTLFQEGTDLGWQVSDLGGGSTAGDEVSDLRAFRNAPAGSAEAFCETGALPFGGTDLSIDPIDYGNIQILP